MKRTGFAQKPRAPLRKFGKKGKQWNKERATLNQAFLRAGITRCEVRLPGCWGEAHGHAHKDKRRNLSAEQLKETVLACNHCHGIIEAKPQPEMAALIQGIIDARESTVKI